MGQSVSTLRKWILRDGDAKIVGFQMLVAYFFLHYVKKVMQERRRRKLASSSGGNLLQQNKDAAAEAMKPFLKEKEQSSSESSSESSEENNNSISFRGKKFDMTSSGPGDSSEDGVDLSFFGSLPFYLPTVIRCVELFAASTGMAPKESHFGRFRQLTWFAFGILPFLDSLLGEDFANPTKEQQKKGRNLVRFRLPLYLWTFCEVIMTVITFREAFQKRGFNGLPMKFSDSIGLLGKLCLQNGAIGITIAHELGHSRNRFETFLAYTLLANVNYMHWLREHTEGHHEKVSTPEDPATSRLGESVYAFVPRCMKGTLESAIELERKRLREEENFEGNMWATPRNRMYHFTLIPFLWSLVLAKAARTWKAIPAFYIIGLVSSAMLEIINYVEHYGLRRNKLEDGTYEPVNPMHSWNAAHQFSNTLLFKLERHSDHHSFSMRPYHLLRNFKQSPNLPTGYPGMVTLSFFPPVQRYIMHPVVEAHNKRCDLMLEKDVDDATMADAYNEYLKQEKIAKRKVMAFNLAAGLVTFKALPYITRAARNLDEYLLKRYRAQKKLV